MKFTYAIAAVSALAGAAYSAPTASATCVVSTDLTLIEPPAGISLDVLIDVASPVGLIVSGLGLSNIAPGLVGLIDGTTTKVADSAVGVLSDVKEIAGVAPDLVSHLVQGVRELKYILESVDEALAATVSEVLSIVEDLIDVVLNLVDVAIDGVVDILKLDVGVQIHGIDNVSLSILTQVASPLSKLLLSLGLDALAPGLVTLLSLLEILP